LLCWAQPAVPVCEAEDLNGDGVVNVPDLLMLLAADEFAAAYQSECRPEGPYGALKRGA